MASLAHLEDAIELAEKVVASGNSILPPFWDGASRMSIRFDPDLSRIQAEQVLRRDDQADTSVGVNWDMLEDLASDIFPSHSKRRWIMKRKPFTPLNPAYRRHAIVEAHSAH